MVTARIKSFSSAKTVHSYAAGYRRLWRVLISSFFLASLPGIALGQKSLKCPNGETHFSIDVQQLTLQYSGQSFQLTLSSLSVLGAKLSADPKTLQAAAVATQQWNELLKGLAAGYNSCAISQQQYDEGLKRIYPRLREDVSDLEQVRQDLLKGQQVNSSRLQQLLDSYFANLRRFAQAGNTQTVEAIRSVVEASEARILANQQQGFEKITEQVTELQKRVESLPKPAEVQKEISGLKQELLAKADEAEREYNTSYELVQKYRFRDAIPHLQAAVAAVPLPAFYVTLAQALRDLPNLAEAERIAEEGLTHTSNKPEYEASLNNTLGLILQKRGNLPGAQRYAERALAIDEKVHGPEHPSVARDANTLGTILLIQGNLPGAQRYTERALAIEDEVYGPEHPNVAKTANNLGQILLAKGDLTGAQRYTERALDINEKVYGPENPNVAIAASNLSLILKEKGDLPGAQRYIERALVIDKKAYGPEHPEVAVDTNNLSAILQARGDLPGAQHYLERALSIDEKLYGPAHPSVARDANNLGQVLQDRGDLPGAQRYTERALTTEEKLYGSEHPEVATACSNLGLILQDRGDLLGAQRYLMRALTINEKVYGPEHPNVAIASGNLGQLLQARGDLPGARRYLQQAVRVATHCFGPEASQTKAYIAALQKISK